MPAELVLAIDIGGTKLAAGLGDVRGSMTQVLMEDTCASEGAHSVLERAGELGRRCLAAAGSDARVVAVGLSTMGHTRNDGVAMAPNVPGWAELRIPGFMAAAFPGLPVAIDNDVRAATLAELAWGALAGVDTGVYLNLGTGIMAGLVVGGRVVPGAHGSAGEIGYSLPAGRVEERMAADGVAPLEERFGGAGMARRLEALLGRPGTVRDLESSCSDRRLAAEAEQLWEGVAVAAANLCIAIDPDVLAVGGGYVRGRGQVLDVIRAVTSRACPQPPEVVVARFSADAALRGASAIAWSEGLGRPLEARTETYRQSAQHQPQGRNLSQ